MPQLLSLGSSGPDVKNVQVALNVRGGTSVPPSVLPPLTPDGIFGPKTRAKVVEFQQRNVLVADGIVGPKTREKLFLIDPTKIPVNLTPFFPPSTSATSIAALLKSLRDVIAKKDGG